jgi:hypothetical protein
MFFLLFLLYDRRVRIRSRIRIRNTDSLRNEKGRRFVKLIEKLVYMCGTISGGV